MGVYLYVLTRKTVDAIDFDGTPCKIGIMEYECRLGEEPIVEAFDNAGSYEPATRWDEAYYPRYNSYRYDSPEDKKRYQAKVRKFYNLMKYMEEEQIKYYMTSTPKKALQYFDHSNEICLTEGEIGWYDAGGSKVHGYLAKVGNQYRIINEEANKIYQAERLHQVKEKVVSKGAVVRLDDGFTQRITKISTLEGLFKFGASNFNKERFKILEVPQWPKDTLDSYNKDSQWKRVLYDVYNNIRGKL